MPYYGILKNIKQFKSTVTTRSSRPGEIDGVDYYFVTREQMNRESNQGTLIEHGEYKGHLYGTSASHLKALMDAGYFCVINPHHQVSTLECGCTLFVIIGF